jgi:pimeloyl-ACP methyl ester carboxylesterase
MKTNPTWFGMVKCVFTLVILSLAVGNATAQTEVTLPAPTGPHQTGRMSFHWKEASRDELETSAPSDKRELMVHLFYPGDAKAAGNRAAYVPDADAMRPPWNDAQVARITTLRAYSRENAALPRGKARYPVVVFMPGGGMKALTYHTLLEDFASHGWVAAAVDPPYNARAVRFPDGRVLGNLQPNERGWPQPRNAAENQRFYRERIVHWARDVSFVIDQLTALDKGKGAFANHLDLKRGVGVFGHSRGGQAAATVRLLDPRVRGGINLDGTAGEFAVIPTKEGETLSVRNRSSGFSIRCPHHRPLSSPASFSTSVQRICFSDPFPLPLA